MDTASIADVQSEHRRHTAPVTAKHQSHTADLTRYSPKLDPSYTGRVHYISSQHRLPPLSRLSRLCHSIRGSSKDHAAIPEIQLKRLRRRFIPIRLPQAIP